MSRNKVCFTNGCFDVLHRGHIELLKFCKANSDYVIVGLNSDKSARRLKGHDRPINTEIDRKFLLESIKYVDTVIIFDEETPYQLISKLKPDIIVKGGDYKKDEVVGSDLAEVKIFETVNGYSTTKAVQRSSNRR
tara:strand:+ start:1016 stop:1420 length:405 start_codon:yes stop_codon:yes gene_type:complete